MELNKDQLKEGKRYVITVSTNFVGKFVGYEEWVDGKYALFEQTGYTDHGTRAARRVKVVNIIEVEQTKRDE